MVSSSDAPSSLYQVITMLLMHLIPILYILRFFQPHFLRFSYWQMFHPLMPMLPSDSLISWPSSRFTISVKNGCLFTEENLLLFTCPLFMLGSGFGWIHAISVFVSDPSDLSQTSSMQIILTSSKQTYDITNTKHISFGIPPRFQYQACHS